MFISFEGCDGSGKSTQVSLLAEALRKETFTVETVREPGGTELGEYLREYLKGSRPLAPLSELILFEAARAELVQTRILPWLAGGAIVIADRFEASSQVYQGCGKGIAPLTVEALNRIATSSTYPDVTVLLDIEPALCRQRGRNSDDRFEKEGLAFHRKVRAGYLHLAAGNPGR